MEGRGGEGKPEGRRRKEREGEKREGEKYEELRGSEEGDLYRERTNLCLTPPPDARGDFDPPGGRPPAPTVVLEGAL